MIVAIYRRAGNALRKVHLARTNPIDPSMFAPVEN